MSDGALDPSGSTDRDLRGKHIDTVDRDRRRAVGLTLLAVVLIGVVAIGSGRSLESVGHTSPALAGRRLVEELLLPFAIVGAAGAVAIAYAFWPTERFRRRQRGNELQEVHELRRPWWAPVAALLVGACAIAAILALTLVLLSRSASAPPRPVMPVQAAHPAAARLVPGVTTSAHTRPPLLHLSSLSLAWWLWLLFGLVLVAVAALGLRSSQLGHLESSDEPKPEKDAATLCRSAAGRLLAEVEEESDPRRAVLRAYAVMEDVLGSYHIVRHPSETPHEFLGRLRSSFPRLCRFKALTRLTELFELAKFGPDAVGEEMKQEAIAALRQLKPRLAANPLAVDNG
jgi:Domain of unknown function (DUF4129)